MTLISLKFMFGVFFHFDNCNFAFNTCFRTAYGFFIVLRNSAPLILSLKMGI